MFFRRKMEINANIIVKGEQPKHVTSSAKEDIKEFIDYVIKGYTLITIMFLTFNFLVEHGFLKAINFNFYMGCLVLFSEAILYIALLYFMFQNYIGSTKLTGILFKVLPFIFCALASLVIIVYRVLIEFDYFRQLLS